MTLVGNRKIDIGLSWDLVRKDDPIDMDLSCVFFDASGKIIDSVYYNKEYSDDLSMTHSNDNRDGRAGGDDESVTIDLEKVHPTVTAIVCNVSCYSEHDFSHVSSSELSIRDSITQDTITTYQLGYCGNYPSVVICVLYKTINGWFMENKFTPCYGKNFQEFKEVMRSAISFLINPQISNEYMLDYNSDRVFDVSKGDIVNINKLKKVSFGIGWNSKCDVDSSCVMMTEDRQVHEIINFGRLTSRDKSVKHSGDNRTGEGEGDDELIYVKLKKVDPNVNSLIFTVSIYSSGYTFDDVSGLYVRMMDTKSGRELLRYKVKNSKSFSGHNSLIVCKLYRQGGVWRFMAIGSAKDGNTAHDLSKHLKRYASDDYRPKVKKSNNKDKKKSKKSKKSHRRKSSSSSDEEKFPSKPTKTTTVPTYKPSNSSSSYTITETYYGPNAGRTINFGGHNSSPFGGGRTTFNSNGGFTVSNVPSFGGGFGGGMRGGGFRF